MFFLEYKSKLHRILIHVLFWLSYISFYSALVAVNTDIGFFEIFLRTFYYVPVDMFATYVTLYFLLPKLLIVRKYLWFAILFIVLAFITIFLNQAISIYVYIPIYFPEKAAEINFSNFDMYVMLASTYVIVVFAAGIKLAKLWLKEQKDKARLESEHIESELALLKSQINPHFIFNTLNNIDTLIQTNPLKASQSIIQLSDIMRYVTYEATSDFVPAEKEINYLKGFIELQKLRFGEDFIKINQNIEQSGKMIAPMLFIPLVENAIKHGDKKNRRPAVEVEIEIGTEVHFRVVNFISLIPLNKDIYGGIGLKNLRRRLELIYPERHVIKTEVSENKFIAELWIH
jgi:two-component system, LytTR family, sensor kinase